jgi:hypothetical protein
MIKNKYLSFLAIFLILGLISAGYVKGQGKTNTTAATETLDYYESVWKSQEGSISIWEILNRAINYVFTFVVGLGIVMLLITAYYYMTSGGDSEKVKKALQSLVYVLVGIVVVFASKMIIVLACKFALGQECNLNWW